MFFLNTKKSQVGGTPANLTKPGQNASSYYAPVVVVPYSDRDAVYQIALPVGGSMTARVTGSTYQLTFPPSIQGLAVLSNGGTIFSSICTLGSDISEQSNPTQLTINNFGRVSTYLQLIYGKPGQGPADIDGFILTGPPQISYIILRIDGPPAVPTQTAPFVSSFVQGDSTLPLNFAFFTSFIQPLAGPEGFENVRWQFRVINSGGLNIDSIYTSDWSSLPYTSSETLTRNFTTTVSAPATQDLGGTVGQTYSPSAQIAYRDTTTGTILYSTTVNFLVTCQTP